MQALSQDTQIGSSDGVCRVVRSVFTACLVCSIADTMRNTSDPRIVLDSGCSYSTPRPEAEKFMEILHGKKIPALVKAIGCLW